MQAIACVSNLFLIASHLNAPSMISWNIPFKTKFLLSVLLVFSGITDVLLGELILHRSIGLGRINIETAL
jgi:hypothetical protein